MVINATPKRIMMFCNYNSLCQVFGLKHKYFYNYVEMTTKDRIQLHYKKNNNTTIFNKLYDLEIKPGTLQNFMPLYDLYFSLNETNWNKINLNHENQLCEIYGQISRNTFNVKTFSEKADKETDRKSFVKISPLLDPVQYIVGKYSNTKKRDEPA